LHGPGGAGGDAGRFESVVDPVVAHVAFKKGTVGAFARNIIGTGPDYFLCIQFGGVGRVQDGACGFVLVNGGLVKGGFQTGGINAVAALVRKKEPVELVLDDLFGHADQFVGHMGQVFGILMAAPVYGFFRWQVVPLLTGDLASPAGGTQGGIYEK